MNKELLKIPPKSSTTGGRVIRCRQNGLHIIKVSRGLKAIFFRRLYSRLKLDVVSCGRLFLRVELRFDPKPVTDYIGGQLSGRILWVVFLNGRILSAFSSGAI